MSPTSYVSVDVDQAVSEPTMFTPDVLREVFPQGIMPSAVVPGRMVRVAELLAVVNTVLLFIAVVVR